MIRLPGLLKIASMLTIDFIAVYALVDDPAVASIVTGVIALYVTAGRLPCPF